MHRVAFEPRISAFERCKTFVPQTALKYPSCLRVRAGMDPSSRTSSWFPSSLDISLQRFTGRDHDQKIKFSHSFSGNLFTDYNNFAVILYTTLLYSSKRTNTMGSVVRLFASITHSIFLR